MGGKDEGNERHVAHQALSSTAANGFSAASTELSLRKITEPFSKRERSIFR